ncbi:MAG: DNA-3-methyladenine glycosylase 2 family protein [Lachnospiraceae bacterium]|nr:DNA-3-methyladenine glycosylase 2 family protein [Lachnospiraceae bacterium]
MIIRIEDDFNLRKIADSGQCFRVREFDNGMFRFITKDRVVYIRPLDEENYEISCSQEEWDSLWHPYFHLDRSYSQVRSRIGVRDKYLQAASKEGLGIRILKQDPWEMIITFIISQQKTIPSIKACVEALSSHYGNKIVTAYEEVYTFPTAHELTAATEEDLRNHKLGYRAPYLVDAAAKVSEGIIDLQDLYLRSDKKVFETLKQISGVGDKVSNCICLFAYGRTRLAPVDTWIKKVIEQEYKGKNPFPKYKDAAGIMQQYIFYYALTHKKELKR